MTDTCVCNIPGYGKFFFQIYSSSSCEIVAFLLLKQKATRRPARKLFINLLRTLVREYDSNCARHSSFCRVSSRWRSLLHHRKRNFSWSCIAVPCAVPLRNTAPSIHRTPDKIGENTSPFPPLYLAALFLQERGP